MENGENNIKQVVEAALFAAGRPLDVDRLVDVLSDVNGEDEQNGQSERSGPNEEERRTLRKPIRQALKQLQKDYEGHGVELVETAGGFRFQVKPDYAGQVSFLWANRPSRYSRAMLETLALIAYRQPITRGQIEAVRGVSVSTQIVKNLLEYNWIRVVGHRNTPGKPLLYGTTRAFLDHFGLKSLEELPPLTELQGQAKIDAEHMRDASTDAEARAAEAAEKAANASEDDEGELKPVHFDDAMLLDDEAPKLDKDLLDTIEQAESMALEINKRTRESLSQPDELGEEEEE